MKDTSDGVVVTLLGKEFMVACPDDQRAALFAAASLVDRKMREIQLGGKTLGSERTAIIAAINIANELIELRASAALSDEAAAKIKALQYKIDTALARDLQAH